MALWVARAGPPLPPRPPAEVQRFAAAVRDRYGLSLPADYRRFLSLADGGQLDNALIYGVGPGNSALERCAELRAERFMVGNAGTVDAYVLRPDGGADVVGFFDLAYAVESFGSFTDLLARLVAAA